MSHNFLKVRTEYNLVTVSKTPNTELISSISHTTLLVYLNVCPYLGVCWRKFQAVVLLPSLHLSSNLSLWNGKIAFMNTKVTSKHISVIILFKFLGESKWRKWTFKASWNYILWERQVPLIDYCVCVCVFMLWFHLTPWEC